MSDKLPATKPAGDLQPGDHVIGDDLHRDFEGIAEVLLAKKFGVPGRQDVFVLISHGDRYEPDSYRLPVDKPIRLASAEALAEREAEDRRQAAASVLHELAALIVNKKLPLPSRYQGFGVTMNFGRDVALVERIGAELGLKVSDSYGTTSVEWPADQEPGGLTATWSAYTPKKAEPAPSSSCAEVSDADPTGLAYSREADDPTPVSPARVPLHTGAMTDGGLVDETQSLVPAPLARHYDTSDGAGGVDCACGAVFTGADAVELLQQHIAAGNAAPSLHSRVLQRHHFSLDESAQREAVEAARVEALCEDNDRATNAVRAGLRIEERGRGLVCNPNMARFMAEKEAKRREAAYYLGLTESAKHYPAAANTVPVPAEDATLTPASAE